MKRIIILAFFCIVGTTITFAQECELCGTWTASTSVGENGENVRKTTIRIKKNKDRYSVRVKDFYTYASGGTLNDYWNDCIQISVSGNTIRWQSFSHTVGEDDWSNSAKINGQVIKSAKYYKICEATSDGDELYLRYGIIGDYYDRNGNVIGHYGDGYTSRMTLYKDDEDW